MDYGELKRSGWRYKGVVEKRGQAKTSLGRRTYKRRTLVLTETELHWFAEAKVRS